MPHLMINNFRCNYLYREYSAGAPCVVFLNGIMSALESWTAQVPVAQKLGFNVLQFEYRGQWRSEMTPGPYSMQTHVDDLKTLMTTLGIERAHLVGTSYGGMTAMKFASQDADMVESLMLITTTALIRPLPQMIVSTWLRLAEQNDIENLLLTALPDLYSEEFMMTHPELISERLAGFRRVMLEIPDFCRGQALLNSAQFPNLSDGSLLTAIANIACPTLVLAAEGDRLYPPADALAIARQISDSEYLVVPGAGHALVAERPQAVNIALAGHLLKVRPG